MDWASFDEMTCPIVSDETGERESFINTLGSESVSVIARAIICLGGLEALGFMGGLWSCSCTCLFRQKGVGWGGSLLVWRGVGKRRSHSLSIILCCSGKQEG